MNYKKENPTAAHGGAGENHAKESEAINAPMGDTSKALAWLRWLRPDGPWVLTAIIPDGITETRTFQDEAAALAWINKYNGKRNLYYSLNPTKGAMKVKAKKEHIAYAEFAHAE